MPDLRFRIIIDEANSKASLQKVEDQVTGIQKKAEAGTEIIFVDGPDGKLHAIEKKVEEVIDAAETMDSEISAPKVVTISAAAALATIRDVTVALTGVAQIIGSLTRSANSLLDASLKQRQAGQLATLAFGGAADEMSRFATELQKVTNFGDDDLLPLMAKLSTTFKLSSTDVKALTMGLLDFTEANKATGMTAESAVDLMGRALNGHTEMLGRYGIELDKTRLASEGVSYLIEKLAQDYGGTAVALADLRTQNSYAWGDIKETIGDMITVVISPLLKGLRWLMEAYNSLSPIAKGFVTGIVIAIPLVVTLAASVTALTAAYVALRAALNPVVGIISLVTAGLTAAAFAYGAAKLNTEDLSASTSKETAMFDALIDRLKTLKNTTQQSAEDKRNLKQTIEDINSKYGQFLTNINLEKSSWDSVAVALDNARNRLIDYQVSKIFEDRFQKQLARVANMRILLDEEEARVAKLSADPMMNYWDKTIGFNENKLGVLKNGLREAEAELARLQSAYTNAAKNLPSVTPPPPPPGSPPPEAGVISEYQRLMAELANLRRTELERIEVLYEERKSLIMSATAKESQEQKNALTELISWKVAELQKLTDRFVAEEDAASKAKLAADDAKFRSDIQYYSNLNELGVSSYDALKKTMEDYYAWAKANLSKEEQAAILLQLQQTNLRWGKVRQAEQDELTRTREMFTTRDLELQDAGFELQLRAIDNFYALNRQKLIDAGITEEQIITQQNEAKRKLYVAGAWSMLSGVSGILANLASTQDKENAKGFKAWKALSMAQAMIDSFSAANAAYKSLAGIPIVGPGLAIAASIAALAAGFANVNKISQTQYQKAATGGLLNGPSHARGGVLIEAEGDEYITSKSRVRSLGRKLFDFLNFAPLDSVKNALSSISLPSIPLPEPSLSFAYGGLVPSGAGSLPGSSAVTTLLGALDDKLGRLLDKKIAFDIHIDPLDSNPVRVSEIADAGWAIRSEI